MQHFDQICIRLSFYLESSSVSNFLFELLVLWRRSLNKVTFNSPVVFITYHYLRRHNGTTHGNRKLPQFSSFMYYLVDSWLKIHGSWDRIEVHVKNSSSPNRCYMKQNAYISGPNRGTCNEIYIFWPNDNSSDAFSETEKTSTLWKHLLF